MTPLMHAASLGNGPMIHLLLHHSASLTETDIGYDCAGPQELAGSRIGWGLSPAHHAVMSGSYDAVHALLEGGADVNARDSANGYTILHMAAKWNNSRIVAMLCGKKGLQKFRNGELVRPSRAYACARV